MRVSAVETLLFDTASLYFRAFFGLPETLRSPDGRPVNAVRGLLDFLSTFVRTYDPARIACCWDDDWRPAWRVDLMPSYKAQRVVEGDAEEAPDALADQVPLIREVLDALGVPIVGYPEHEADDVIATLATLAPGSVGVVTGDRDLFQLVDGAKGVEVMYVARGVRKHERIDEAALLAKSGITGAQYVDYAVMRGDPSDGLPGVKGIGEKTAATLLQQYGDLDGIVAAAPNLSPALRRSVEASVDYVAAAKPVVTAVRTLPLGDIDLTRPRAPRDPQRFAQLAAELGLGGAADRILQALAGV